MKTFTTKTTFFSKWKLGASRNPECRIFHHLPQTPQTLQPNFNFFFKSVESGLQYTLTKEADNT